MAKSRDFQGESFPFSVIFSHSGSFWNVRGGFRLADYRTDFSASASLFKDFFLDYSVNMRLCFEGLYHVCFLREGAFLHDILGRGAVECRIVPSRTSLYLSGGVGVTGTHVLGLPSRLGAVYELLSDCLFSVSQGLGDLFEVRGGVGFASSFFEYSNGSATMPMVFVGVTYLGERLRFSVDFSRWYTAFGYQDNVHIQKQGVTLGVEYDF